ncbi:trigger factor [Sulfurimonas sp. HSL-1716]|uniref:trigger factor n=1 Tax=Hydrocurvibacter sulfurireducens TaxID=3131937 RepID=UPI0031F8C551
MDIKANKIDTANANIKATISNDVIQANVDKIAKQLSKTANIAGFRKGKVPLSAVKKQYGAKLLEDAETQSLRDVLDAGLKQIEVAAESLIGDPQVVKFDKSDEKIEVEVKIAMRPEIDLGEYASLIDTFEKPEVTDEEVMSRIKELAESQAPLKNSKSARKLKKGDTVSIDFEGFLDGVAFEGGKAEAFSLQLGSGQFIPGFEDQVIGMKKGEEKTITVTFPADYGSEKLAGKETEFKVKVNAIQEKEEVALDDELAKKMLPGEDDASFEKLKEQVKTQLENEKLSQLYNSELKPKLLETFVAKIEFALPEFVVDQEIDMAINKKAQTMSEDELKELRENADKVTELRETFREDAANSVKATFIIDALAKAENISVTEQELMQTIYFEAMQMGQDPQQTYTHYQNSGYLPAIQMAMVEDKVLNKLLNAKIKDA